MEINTREAEIITDIIKSIMQMSDVQRLLLLTYGNGLIDGEKIARKKTESENG